MLVKILNLVHSPYRIEFLNNTGNKDSCTIAGRQSIILDEDLLILSKNELSQKGIKICDLSPKLDIQVSIDTELTTVIEPVTTTLEPNTSVNKHSKQNNYSKQNNIKTETTTEIPIKEETSDKVEEQSENN